MNAQVDSKKETNGEIRIKLTHTLDKTLYALPLTLKTYVDSNPENISVKQGAQTIPFVTARDENGSYILYQAIPNGNDITITEI
jgi:hypothetical protein